MTTSDISHILCNLHCYNGNSDTHIQALFLVSHPNPFMLHLLVCTMLLIRSSFALNF